MGDNSQGTQLVASLFKTSSYNRSLGKFCFIFQYRAEACPESCQTTKIELFAKIVNGFSPLFLQNPPSLMFDRVVNMYLHSILVDPKLVWRFFSDRFLLILVLVRTTENKFHLLRSLVMG